MPLISLEQARVQVRVEADYPSEQLQPYIDGAAAWAEAYLNRAVFESEQELTAAREGYAEAVANAVAKRRDAEEAAAGIEDPDERAAALRLAEVVYREERALAERCIHGIVVNDGIRTGMRLLVGHLFSNRETVVVGAQVAEVPVGAASFLRPYRRVMMP